MRKIGLLGESPNDTNAVKNLLSREFKNVKFVQLLRNIKGWHLDNKKTKERLKIEYEAEKPYSIIFIRDLDGLESEKTKLDIKNRWFNELNTLVNSRGVFMLNIYEIEALILADIGTFNKLYKTKIKFEQNPMFTKDPKEYLMSKTSKLSKRYSESHTPEIFSQLNFKALEKKCAYFKKFIVDFKKVI